MKRILVVGGGISGMATALVLSRQGMAVDLVERNQEIKALGSGITLIGPALRALERLGVLDDCLEQGYGCNDWVMCDLDGEIVHRIPTPSPITDVGAELPGVLGMTRPGLHRILIERVKEEGVTIRLGVSPTKLADHIDRVSVRFSDDTHTGYDLVVAADGLRSTTRDLTFEKLTPTFQRQGCFRAVLPRPDEVSTEMAFLGHGTIHIGFTPTGKDSMYMYCVVPATDTTQPPASELPGLLRVYMEPFGGVGAWARERVNDPELINYTAFETFLAPSPWHRGRVVMVGDAAHATTPHIASGAAMCLEDAIVLGEELASAHDVPDALKAYSQRRYDRCSYVVNTSATLSRWETHPNAPDADPQGLRAQAFAVLAEPF